MVKARAYNPVTGMESLIIIPVSKAQALQRRYMYLAFLFFMPKYEVTEFMQSIKGRLSACAWGSGRMNLHVMTECSVSYFLYLLHMVLLISHMGTSQILNQINQYLSLFICMPF